MNSNIQNKPDRCYNYLLCNQFINKTVNNNFCKDCLFYFNVKLIFRINKKEKLTCPICLYSPQMFIKQKNCDHYICMDCIYSVYFDKSFIQNMPHNPIQFLKKSWDLFIYGNISVKFKKHLMDIYLNNEFNEYRFKINIDKYRYLIPGLFKKNIKSLIQYQLLKNKYISEYKDKQYEKIKILKKCPYCRSYNNPVVNNTPERTVYYINTQS